MNVNHARYAGIYLAVATAIGYVSYRSSGAFLQSLGAGLLASVVATFFLVRLDVKSTSRLGRLGLPDGDYPPRILATGMVDASPETAIAVCREGIEHLPNFGTIEESEPGKCIRAKTRRSWISWGEVITIQAEPEDGGTRLQVGSVPVLWTVTEDMRCNFQNVALILRHVHRALPIQDVEPKEYFAAVLARNAESSEA